MTKPDEHRVLNTFRREFNQIREDLDAFTADFDGTDFEGWSTASIRDWCRSWWEARLGGRLLDHGERRLRGTQGRN